MNISQIVKDQLVNDISQSEAIKFENDFVNSFKEDYPELDSSLLEITPRPHRSVTHAIYNSEYKYVSKRGLVNVFNHYRSVCEEEGFSNKFVEGDVILKDWKTCMTSDLLPDILEEKSQMFKTSYMDPKIYRGITPKDLHYIRKNKNKDRIISYYDLIKDQSVCINDFNLDNFIINTKTDELVMVDVGDIDYTDRFIPGLFFTHVNEKYSFYICRDITDISIKECKSHLEWYLGGVEEIVSIQSF